MLLPRDKALRFIEAYKSILLTALELVGVERTESIIADLSRARSELLEDSDLLEKSIAGFSAQNGPMEADLVQAIRSMKVSQWVYLRQTKTAAIFIDQKIENAYSVKALTNPIYQVVDVAPSMFIAGVFQYIGCFVCDGIIENPVMLGPGYKAQFKAAYSIIRKAGHHHTKTEA